jgi:hypothetical protein
MHERGSHPGDLAHVHGRATARRPARHHVHGGLVLVRHLWAGTALGVGRGAHVDRSDGRDEGDGVKGRSYIRVLPERVPELEAQGWHPVATSGFSGGHGFEVVMVRFDDQVGREVDELIPVTQGND